jgi:hypothetical protein
VAVVPLNLTVLPVPPVPKFAPAIVIELPTAPCVGVRLVMLGVASTLKLLPLLATLETVTTTLPVVVPVGTVVTILVALQQVPQTVAVLPLNFIVLVPWLDPKLVPVMVTEAPTAPDAGLRVVIAGAVAAALLAAIETNIENRIAQRTTPLFRDMMDSSEMPRRDC